MEIFSTWYHDEHKIKPLSQDLIVQEIKRAENVTIISAYYSVVFLEKILSKVTKIKRKKCVLNLLFNGFSGQRLYDQLNELKTLTTSLKKMGFFNIAIFLNRETALFHTKLYFIKNEQGSVWFSGSANASFSAFEKNEELLFKSSSKINSLKQYISEVVSDSALIEDINPDEAVESNIIGFFRTGSIDFKPNHQLSFTFSEFKLPEWVEDRIRNIEDRPRNTNPGKAWGSYNLKLSLGLMNDENDKVAQISLKPWSIETCYGYWVPNRYRSIVNKNVDQRSKSIKAKLVEVLDLINSRGIDSLLEDYKNYLNDAKVILKSNNINYPIDEDELISKYQRFVERIIFKLSDQDRLKKLCLPLVSTGMPEIWEDNIAYEDFSESFYEYTASCLTAGQIPRVVRSIMDNLDFTIDADGGDIMDSFAEYFESDEAEWSDEYWRE
ncbi:MAG: phospholipase D family protein [Deltaproteobacteria bacterium]|nr:phospholipase D family protein [Candidatus Tharpella aukensis]